MILLVMMVVTVDEPMVNLHVMMEVAYQAHGNVMGLMTVMMALMKPTVHRVDVKMVISLTVLMMIAVQSPGLVMALKTVKIRLMAVILPATIVMVAIVTVMGVLMVVELQVVVQMVVAVNPAKTVNLISPIMVANAVIQPGMNMVLIVQH